MEGENTVESEEFDDEPNRRFGVQNRDRVGASREPFLDAQKGADSRGIDERDVCEVNRHLVDLRAPDSVQFLGERFHPGGVKLFVVDFD